MASITKLRSIATPQQSTVAFTAAINAADLDAATNCFAKDACLVTPDATAIRGRQEIRSAAADGATFIQRSNPALTLRYLEGVWKLAIAAPWGWGHRERTSRAG